MIKNMISKKKKNKLCIILIILIYKVFNAIDVRFILIINKLYFHNRIL